MATLLLLTRIASIVILFLEGIIGGQMAVVASEKGQNEAAGGESWLSALCARIYTLGNIFCGGMFLSLSIIHILPEAAEDAEPAFGKETSGRYRVAYLVAATAYLLLLFLQRVVPAIVDSWSSTSSLTPPLSESPRHADHAEELSVDVVGVVIGTDKICENPQESPTVINNANECAPAHPKKENTEHVSQTDLERDHRTKVRAWVLLASLAIHSISEGLAVGLERSPSAALSLAAAVIVHKFAAAAALSLILLEARLISDLQRTVGIVVFSLCSPVGIALGWVAQETLPAAANSILSSFVAGTLLYLSMEITAEEFAKPSCPTAKFLTFAAAVAMIWIMTFALE